MNFKFENQGTNTYLVYQMAETDEMDSMSLGMLTNNHIPGFAQVSFTQMDMTKYIKYNVSAEVSVKQLFTGPVNKKRLLGVFTGVVDAMLSAEEYMLDPSTILLDTDYIFADVSSCQAELVCLPIMNLQQQNPDLATFFKNILFTTQFDQTENCDHVAQLINYLNTNPILILEDFKNLLHTLAHGAPAQAPVAPVQQPVQPVQPVQPAPQPAAQAPVQPIAQPVQPVQPVQRPQPVQPPVQPPVQKNTPPVPPVPPVPGMQIPVAAPAPAPNKAPAAPQGTPDGKPMTLMYLMQHYTKENAAIYKAQQEAAKKKKNAPAPAAQPMPGKPMAAPMPGKPMAAPMPGKPMAAPMPGKAAPAKPQPGPGFAIPGQAAPGFAIPGQPTPPPAPATPVAPKQPAPAPVNPIPAPPVQPAPQPVYQPAPQVQSAPLNFGETTVLSAAMGETTVLSSAVETKQNDPHLIRAKNNEKIPLNKPVFRIGKEKSYVDYFIGDNTAISRSHANIIDHNGEFFVVDTNSTNHTYVNGGMIQSGVETKLSHGTKIRFANEEFEFKMY